MGVWIVFINHTKKEIFNTNLKMGEMPDWMKDMKKSLIDRGWSFDTDDIDEVGDDQLGCYNEYTELGGGAWT